MAHKKASASTANQGSNRPGKRLGVKKFGGELARAGQIIAKQKGTHFFAGKNTYLARDFTIHAKVDGTVKFRTGTGNKRGSKLIDIVPLELEAKA
jgi:large subunit ribosomal protein L27